MYKGTLNSPPVLYIPLTVHPASLYGTVSASYTIEQLGLPTLSRAVDGSALWNDTDPHSRLQQLEEKYS